MRLFVFVWTFRRLALFWSSNGARSLIYNGPFLRDVPIKRLLLLLFFSKRLYWNLLMQMVLVKQVTKPVY